MDNIYLHKSFLRMYLRIFTFAIIMPLNGYIFLKYWWLGLVLIILQLPSFISREYLTRHI